MLSTGLLFGAGGGAIVLWPQSLAWIVGGAFGLVAAFFVVSALAARGR